jgi:hypothetical protein
MEKNSHIACQHAPVAARAAVATAIALSIIPTTTILPTGLYPVPTPTTIG